MAVGLSGNGNSSRRVVFDTSDSNARYILSSADSIEWQTRDSRYVETLPAGQSPGTKLVIVFPWVGLG